MHSGLVSQSHVPVSHIDLPVYTWGVSHSSGRVFLTAPSLFPKATLRRTQMNICKLTSFPSRLQLNSCTAAKNLRVKGGTRLRDEAVGNPWTGKQILDAIIRRLRRRGRPCSESASKRSTNVYRQHEKTAQEDEGGMSGFSYRSSGSLRSSAHGKTKSHLRSPRVRGVARREVYLYERLATPPPQPFPA